VGLPAGSWKIRDLWRQKDLGEHDSGFVTELEAHAVTLISLKKVK